MDSFIVRNIAFNQPERKIEIDRIMFFLFLKKPINYSASFSAPVSPYFSPNIGKRQDWEANHCPTK